jgi:hypothetical protein
MMFIVESLMAAPRFCHECGQPYPWTEAKLAAAQELADELEGLTSEEREKLKASVVELTRDTAQTELAVVRYKKIIKKVGGAGGAALNKIVVGVATEAAKKLLGM